MVSQACRGVYEETKKAAHDNDFTLVLGGDHSIAIGSIAGLLSERYPDLAVIWFDAHADINTLQTTVSGKLHGCPVSFLLRVEGNEEYPFDWLKQSKGWLTADRIGYIGLRDVEDAEQEILDELNIYHAPMKMIRHVGSVEECAKQLLKAIDPESKRPLHLSFDVDGIDPLFTPSTGTPVTGGLTLEEAVKIVKMIKDTGRLVSMDIVEVNTKLGKAPGDAEKTIASTLAVLDVVVNK